MLHFAKRSRCCSTSYKGLAALVMAVFETLLMTRCRELMQYEYAHDDWRSQGSIPGLCQSMMTCADCSDVSLRSRMGGNNADNLAQDSH